MRLVVIVAALGLLSACAADAPAVPVGPDGEPDPVLVSGREVYGDRCATCHGGSGGGDRGPKLADGRVVESLPDPVDQFTVIHDGRGQMPAFGDSLTDEQIDAVVRYTREVL